MGLRGAKKGRIRDKVKRVILVSGTPDILYKNKERTLVRVNINNKEFTLGHVQNGFVEELKKIPDYIITQEKKVHKYPISIKIEGIGNRVHVKKVNGDTHITVGASDEPQLNERIKLVEDYLDSKKVYYKKKCYWVCDIEKSNRGDIKSEEKKEIVNNIKKDNAPENKEVKKLNIFEKKEQDKELKRAKLKNIIMKAEINP